LFVKDANVSNYQALSKNDFIDSYREIGKVYLQNKSIKKIKLSEKSNQYIVKTFNRFMMSNEILFSQGNEITFIILEDPQIYLFTLPENVYVYSSGLFNKFLKSEELFLASFSAALVKSNRLIFNRNEVYPYGIVNLETILKIGQVDLETKKGINQWAYTVLKRAGHDGTAYLNWIQVQNRNALDFALMLGEGLTISREEQAFKNFLSKQGITSLEKRLSESNSTKEFYELIKEIKRN
jgi:hypothetical protein